MNKIFISHALEDTPANTLKLGRLYKYLKDNLKGFDVILDTDPNTVLDGDPLTDFMEDSLKNCSCVICVCTPKYFERSNVENSGVYIELDLINKRLETTDELAFSVIPLILDGDYLSSVPFSLKEKTLKTNYLDDSLTVTDLQSGNKIDVCNSIKNKFKKTLIYYKTSFVLINPEEKIKIFEKGCIHETGNVERKRIDLVIYNKTNKALPINFIGIVDNNFDADYENSKVAFFNEGVSKEEYLEASIGTDLQKVVFELAELNVIKNYLIKKQIVRNDICYDYDFDVIFEVDEIKFNLNLRIGPPYIKECRQIFTNTIDI